MGSNLSCALTAPVCVPNEELTESLKNPPTCQSGKTLQAIVAGSSVISEGPGTFGGTTCPDGQTSIKSCCK